MFDCVFVLSLRFTFTKVTLSRHVCAFFVFFQQMLRYWYQVFWGQTVLRTPWEEPPSGELHRELHTARAFFLFAFTPPIGTIKWCRQAGCWYGNIMLSKILIFPLNEWKALYFHCCIYAQLSLSLHFLYCCLYHLYGQQVFLKMAVAGAHVPVLITWGSSCAGRVPALK